MPRLSGSSETRGARGTGLGRDARDGSARNLPSLGPGASPPPFHPGRTLEGPNPDGPSGASPHSLSHSDDSSSGCRTLSCALAGSGDLRNHFCKKLGLDAHKHAPQTTPDGRFTVEFVECLADCGNAPVVLLDDDLLPKVTADQADSIIAKGTAK